MLPAIMNSSRRSRAIALVLVVVLVLAALWAFSNKKKTILGARSLDGADPDFGVSLAPCASMASYVSHAHPLAGGKLAGVVLLTGNAGFIGHHLTRRLLKDGYAVIGVDMLRNDDETTALLQLARLRCQGFTKVDPAAMYSAFASERAPSKSCFVRAPLSEGLLDNIIAAYGVTHIVHLAAQAGVRKSLTEPQSYLVNNIQATFGVLNAARRHSAAVDTSAKLGLLPTSEAAAAIAAAASELGVSAPAWSKALPASGGGTILHVVYASSSSVYGETDGSAAKEDVGCADRPLSMYAASKRSTELIASSYGSMFHLPSTGLRFFTVYGNHGRPDMAVWKFSDAVLTGRPLMLTATTDFKRDFTHVSDIVDGIVCIMLHPPGLREAGEAATVSRAPAKAMNIGRADPSSVDNLIKLIEASAAKTAVVERIAALNVDVTSTHADVGRLMAMCGKSPATPLAQGVAQFVQWYKAYMTGENQCGDGWVKD